MKAILGVSLHIDGVDVLLLCAVPVEWDCLKEVLVDPVSDPALSDPAIRGRIEIGGRSLSAALVEVGMGLTVAAMATLKAVEHYEPSLVAFVGIAGGLKDVAIGDVVVADKVYPYEIGKVAGGQFESRADTRTLRTDLTGLARKVRANFTPSGYQLYVGAVASGDKVVADMDSNEIQNIRALGSDSLAVEMEGSSILSAIDRAAVNPDYFLIRGISDLIANKSETDAEGGQECAIENARETTLQLIRAWEGNAQVGLPLEQTRMDVLAAGLPIPSPSECFVLLAPPHSATAEAVLKSGMPIALVVDLDPRSDDGGLRATTRSEVEGRRAIHVGSPSNPPAFGPRSLAWVSVQGLDSPVTDLKAWTRGVRRSWRTALSAFATAIGGRRVTILIADDGNADWDAWRSALVDDLLTEFGDRAYLGVLGSGRSVDADFRLALQAPDLAIALAAIIPPESLPSARMLPGSGGPVDVSAKDASWIEEDVTVFWMADPSDSEAESATLDFLRGGEITPAGLAADADVTRTQSASIQKQLLGMLGNRRTLRLNLFHAPGAGGSTIARRIAFDIRKQFPVVLLNRFREGETVRRIESLSRQTSSAIFVVVEAPALRDDQVAALMEELHSVSLPAVVLAVSRAYSPPSAASSSPYIPEVLDNFEAEAFVDAYAGRNYAAREELRTIAGYPDHRRNAFFFGLVAFEADFRGLDAFVGGRLAGFEGAQRQVMLVCSIAHFFGQRSVPEYALARLVGLPPSRAGSFVRILAPELRSLLWRTPEGAWRTTHPLIAEEILRQLGGGRDLWPQALSKSGRTFADFCLDGGDDDAMRQLIESVFTERDDDAALSGAGREKFARLIERIPSQEGASQLLRYVADRQPDHPHIWAHTARYYALRMHDFSTAEIYAKRASALSPGNATLHHILGMVYRSRVYDGLGRNVTLDELSPWVEDASNEFAICRDLAPSSRDHGFVSEIQMHVKIVEHAIREKSLSEYLRVSPHRLVVSSVERAEGLISALRYRGDPKGPSGFEQTERAKLTRIYGDYSTALQLLDSLLKRGTVPPEIVRRQLVWTYLARADRNWRALAPKDVDRVVALLDENLSLEGHTSADALAWWRAVRLKNPAVSHERVKEMLAYWRESNPCLDAEYCSYVAYALDVLAGLPASVGDATRHARRSQDMARSEGTRTRSVDWLGAGQGMAALVHHSELGKWDPALDFWADASRLRVVEARVTKIQGPQAGTAEISGLTAFFVPQRAGVIRGRDENERIRGYLAFTHDGLRIWEPSLIE